MVQKYLSYISHARLHSSDDELEALPTKQVLLWGGLLLLLTLLATVSYYLYRPYAELTADTPGYLRFAQQLRTTGNPINVFRLPTYPLFLLVISFFTGPDNLFAVSIVQGLLFILAVLEFYLLAILLFRHSWIAFCISVLVGTNVILISYSKVLMTEGLALWLLITSLLLAVSSMRTGNVRRLKWLAVCLALLFFTRPEWASFPVLLFAYLLWARYRRGNVRPWLSGIVRAVAVLYVLLGIYICCNFFINHYFGLTYVENMNLIGKVMQYQMQNEVPSGYEHIRRIIDSNVTYSHLTPYQLVAKYPELGQNNARPLGDFARAIIWRHPFEFVGKTIPLLFESLTSYYPVSTLPAPSVAPQPAWIEQIVASLFSFHRALYAGNVLFPYCSIIWLGLLCWPRTRKRLSVQGMGLIVMTAWFALVLTTLGGYFLSDYMRVHIVFDALIILTVWGAILYVPSIFFELLIAQIPDRMNIQGAPQR
ncbi:hypothetical protein KDW_28050 [Dictyobacter vulcani]|uniref:Glycosyltransferase RgtA/B/C/D-like domain-containing protein n=1 Tax=Dictyobacter vulcani TaxID=2607529 RepID=A0A5J4KLI7_9CHLR|nr:hypothetical protein [Dictyobacter vulcani]GER88643.1 hypothetical protein KDW_28050 [Dictyobacter vulcani]